MPLDSMRFTLKIHTKSNGSNIQYFATNTETCRKVRTNSTAVCCSTYLLQSFYRHIIFTRDFYVKEKSIVLNTKAEWSLSLWE